MNVAEEGFQAGLWRYATQPEYSWPDTNQSLYFCTHAMLWRLRSGNLLADLSGHIAREAALANGALHPGGIAALRWQGALAGLPVALWPALMALDARVPAPPATWSWADAAALPAGSGWPLQLMPDGPPLEGWLWSRHAELISADGSATRLTQPAALAALHAYAQAFGPRGAGALSPPPGGAMPAEVLAAMRSGAWTVASNNLTVAWQRQAMQRRDQQVRQRSVQAWFPIDEWPPLTPAPHRQRDDTGPLRRLPVPGAAQGGLPVIVHGLGIRRDTAQPDLAYAAARALQDTAPAYLPYAPFTAQQTASAVQTRWPQLDAEQAAAIAMALKLPLRPVWSVLSGPYFHDDWRSIGEPGDVLQSAGRGGEWNDRQYIETWDLPSMNVRIVKALCEVLALGVIPVHQAAANANAALQSVLAEWTRTASA